MSQRHADIWSHIGHYLADPYILTWSPNGHSHGHEWPTSISFFQCPSVIRFRDNSYPWSRPLCVVKGQGHIWGLEFNRYVCFSIRGNQTILARYYKIYIWPWKFQTTISHIIRLLSLRFICKNNNRLISDEQKILQNFFYKITFNGSETIVTRKFALQRVREQTPINPDQKPRTWGNEYIIRFADSHNALAHICIVK